MSKLKMVMGTGGDLDYLVVQETASMIVAIKDYGWKVNSQGVMRAVLRIRVMPAEDADWMPMASLGPVTFTTVQPTYSSGKIVVPLLGEDPMELVMEEAVNGKVSKAVAHFLDSLIEGPMVEDLADQLHEYFSEKVQKMIADGELEGSPSNMSGVVKKGVWLDHVHWIKKKYGQYLQGDDEAEELPLDEAVVAEE